MGSGLWCDLFALVRSVDLAGVVPRMRYSAVEYIAAYRQVVSPIVETILGRSGPRRYLGDSMCEACAELCFLLAAYAATAKVPFRADLAVLGGAVARVYDDLVDERGDDALVQRLSALFNGETFSPANAVEQLLSALYLELEQRLDRQRSDPIYPALAALHEVQVRSRRQRDPEIPSPVLADITRAKGGYATVVLFALMRPAMEDRELMLVRNLGAALQLVDDYVDVAADREVGFTTSATRRELSLRHVCRMLRDLQPAIRACYGQDQPLCGVVYLGLWMCFVKRRLPRRLMPDAPIRVALWLAGMSRSTI